jgi:hypothetical protein
MSRRDFFSRLKRIEAFHKTATAFPILTAPIRLSSYAGYRGLEIVLGKNHPHERVIAQARRLQQTSSLRSATGSHVLFFTVRGWFIHVATEAVLAKALQWRDARVSFFLCGGQVPQCDFKPATDPHVTRPLCWRCTGFPTRFLDAFHLSHTNLRGVLGNDFNARPQRLIAGLSKEKLQTFSYRDLSLYELALPSIQRSLLRGDPGTGRQADRVAAGMVHAGIIFADACEHLLTQQRPDRIVATNGLFLAERIMLELAHRHAIPVITYERGMVRNSVLFDRDRPAVRFHMDEIWDATRDCPLTDAENTTLDTYLGARMRGQEGQDLWPRMDSDRKALVARFGLAADRPLVVLFTNIMWDSAVFRRDVGFGGMVDWLVSTMRWFAARPDLQLLIRVHPSEIRLPLAESRDRVEDRIASAYPVLPPNIKVVPPSDVADSYVLIRMAAAVMVYTSTVAVEAAVSGRPVVVAGNPHYRGRGFTFDLTDSRHLDVLIPSVLASRALPAMMQTLARRYAYAFFFRFMQSFPWVIDNPRSDRRLAFDSLEQLRPGADATLDRICNGILNLSPFAVLPGMTREVTHRSEVSRS